MKCLLCRIFALVFFGSLWWHFFFIRYGYLLLRTLYSFSLSHIHVHAHSARNFEFGECCFVFPFRFDRRLYSWIICIRSHSFEIQNWTVNSFSSKLRTNKKNLTHFLIENAQKMAHHVANLIVFDVKWNDWKASSFCE